MIVKHFVAIPMNIQAEQSKILVLNMSFVFHSKSIVCVCVCVRVRLCLQGTLISDPVSVRNVNILV